MEKEGGRDLVRERQKKREREREFHTWEENQTLIRHKGIRMYYILSPQPQHGALPGWSQLRIWAQAGYPPSLVPTGTSSYPGQTVPPQPINNQAKKECESKINKLYRVKKSS